MEDYLKIKIGDLTIKKEEPKISLTGSVYTIGEDEQLPDSFFGPMSMSGDTIMGIAMQDTKSGDLISIYSNGVFKI